MHHNPDVRGMPLRSHDQQDIGMALADIDTIIVTIMENRSFDHILGYLNLPGAGRIPCDGLQADPAWLAKYANIEAGLHYQPHRLDRVVQFIADPAHSCDPIATQIRTPSVGSGQMGGFVKSYAEQTNPVPPEFDLVMGYYDASALPVCPQLCHLRPLVRLPSFWHAA